MTSSPAWNAAIRNELQRGLREPHYGLINLHKWSAAMCGLTQSRDCENLKIPDDKTLQLRNAINEVAKCGHVKHMTPQEINIAIAKACGWKPAARKIKNYPTFQHADGRRCTIANLPNYYRDLNAMHEAEKTCLRPTPSDNAMQRDEKFVRWDNYIEFLAVKMGRDDAPHATAAQRAEAFLRTLNLWKTSCN